MNESILPYEERRAQLAIAIARQRGELVVAYRNIEKPIRYAETGMRGISFLRQNQWIFVAAPTVVSLVFSFFGLRKGQAPRTARETLHRAEGSRGILRSLPSRAYQLYQLYRRVRPFFP